MKHGSHQEPACICVLDMVNGSSEIQLRSGNDSEHLDLSLKPNLPPLAKGS